MPQSKSRRRRELFRADQRSAGGGWLTSRRPVRLRRKGAELEDGETLECVVHFADGLGHGSLAVRVEQRAAPVGEERSGKDDAAWADRSRPFESPCQFKNRTSAASHRGRLNDDRRHRPARRATVDVVDYAAEVACNLLPTARAGQLVGAQRKGRVRFARASGRDLAVEFPAGHECLQPERRRGAPNSLRRRRWAGAPSKVTLLADTMDEAW